MKIQIVPDEDTASSVKPRRRTFTGFLIWMTVCLAFQLALHFGMSSARGRPFSPEDALLNGFGMGLSTYLWFKVL